MGPEESSPKEREEWDFGPSRFYFYSRCFSFPDLLASVPFSRPFVGRRYNLPVSFWKLLNGFRIYFPLSHLDMMPRVRRHQRKLGKS